jgi:hypothetical protein
MATGMHSSVITRKLWLCDDRENAIEQHDNHQREEVWTNPYEQKLKKQEQDGVQVIDT